MEDLKVKRQGTAGDFRSAGEAASPPILRATVPLSGTGHRPPATNDISDSGSSLFLHSRTDQCRPVRLTLFLDTVGSGTRPHSTFTHHPRGPEGAANAVQYRREKKPLDLGYSGQHLAGQAQAQFTFTTDAAHLVPPRPLLTWLIAHRQIWGCSVWSRRVVLRDHASSITSLCYGVLMRQISHKTTVRRPTASLSAQA